MTAASPNIADHLSGLDVQRGLDGLDDSGPRRRPRAGEALEQRSDAQVVIGVGMAAKLAEGPPAGEDRR